MPNFTYNTNIPAASNNPSVDQPNMQTNTNSINSIVNVDMIGFGNANGGYHSKVTLIQQGSDPAALAGADILYSKTDTELYLEKPTGSPIQMTRGTAGTNGNGSYSFLPGGFLIQWGSVTSVNNTATVTFPVSFTSAPTSFTATVRNGAGIYGIASVQVPSNSGGVINSSIINQVIYWTAIGV